MATKSDWEAVYRDVVARGRERIDPPEPEALVAYSRGELPEDEAEKVRQALAYYPDLALLLVDHRRLLPNEAQYLSDAQIAADWEALQRRLSEPAPAPPPQPQPQPEVQEPTQFPQPAMRVWQWAIAASLLFCLSLAGVSLWAIMELRRPRVTERIVLHDDRTRGGTGAAVNAVQLQPGTKYVVVTLALADNTREGTYRVEIVDHAVTPPKVVWSSPITRGADGSFAIEVPRSFLRSQRYRANLYVREEDQPIGTYAFPPAAE